MNLIFLLLIFVEMYSETLDPSFDMRPCVFIQTAMLLDGYAANYDFIYHQINGSLTLAETIVTQLV